MSEGTKTKITTDIILLFLILLFASILRFWNFSQMPYMHDELSALARTDFGSLSELIAKGARVDGHPIGVQVFLFYWTKAFGYNEMVVKTPFIICGILSIYIAYKIAKKWFNSSVGLIVAAFMSTMQYMIMYSQIARPYVSGLFFSLLMVWCWSNYLMGSESKKKWLTGLVLSAVFCAYDHHFALLFAGLVGVTGFFFINKSNWKGYVVGFLGAIILYIPHIGIFFFQLSKGGVGGEGGWLSKPDSDWLLVLLRYAFHFSFWMYALVLSILILSIFKRAKDIQLKQKFRIISILWFLIVFAIGYLYSIKINPVLQVSTVIFVFPFFLIFIFSLFEELGKKLKITIVATILIFGTTTLVFSRKHFNVFYHQPYQQQIVFTNAVLDKIGGSKNATIELFVPPFFKEYYFKKYDKKFDFIYYNGFDEIPSQKAFGAFVNAQTTNFFIAGNLPLEYVEIIREKYPFLVNKEEGFTYSVYCYSNQKQTPKTSENIVFTDTNDFNNTSSYWNQDVSLINKESPANEFYYMDSTKEYSATFVANLRDIIKEHGVIFNINVTVESYKKESNPTLVFTVNDGEESLFWSGSDYKNAVATGLDKSKLFLSYMVNSSVLKKHPYAEVKIYVWNKDKTAIAIDDFNVEAVISNPLIYGLYEPIE